MAGHFQLLVAMKKLVQGSDFMLQGLLHDHKRQWSRILSLCG
jgi:hypothetical protein